MTDRSQYPRLQNSSALISDACRMFESTRRKVYRHCNWPYQLKLPGKPSRTEGVVWCQVSAECSQCNQQYTSIPPSSYLMWKACTPVKCDHRSIILDINVVPEGWQAGQGMGIQMPSAVRSTDPRGASESTGGLLTADKLRRDIERINTRSKAALDHLRTTAHEVEVTPAPAYFPELQLTYINERISLIEEETENVLDNLQAQLEQIDRVEDEVEDHHDQVEGAGAQPVVRPINESTPSR